MKKILLAVFLIGTMFSANAQTTIAERFFAYPSGTAADPYYNGNLLLQKPLAGGQYINLIRTGTQRWSIGMVYNTNNFAIGTSTTSDASFTNPGLVLTPSGNFGLGTTDPIRKLEVVGSAAFQAGENGRIILNDNFYSSSNKNSPKLSFWGQSTMNGTTSVNGPSIQKIYNSSYGTSGQGRLAFFQHSAANYSEETEVLSLLPNGNLGIGTTDPGHKLAVKGNVYINSNVDDNHIYWGGHNMTMGTPVDEYAHNIFSLKPGGADAGELLSRFCMYHAYSKTNIQEKVRISTSEDSYFMGGKIGIGTNTPTTTLDVNGKIRSSELDVKGLIRATEIKVLSVDSFPDYVFEENYILPQLTDVSSFINKNGHLPEIPSAQEVKEKGINLVEMQVKLLRKIEELTLYTIEQQKRIEKLEKQLGESQH